MTSKYKLLIEYNGTNYSGWQKQPQKKTIQSEIETALFKLFGTSVPVTGSGRTDAGVHASGQCAHIVLTDNSIVIPKLHYSLNAVLPQDIVIKEISRIESEFHARFSTTGKTYRYYISKRRKISPFQTPFRHALSYPINLNLMREAAAFLIGEHDFISFSNTGRYYKTTVRTVYDLDIRECHDDVIITITGNGFLYKMVRNIVGTLLNVGREKISPSDMITILNGKNRIDAGESAPAKGLFLHEVFYGEFRSNSSKECR